MFETKKLTREKIEQRRIERKNVKKYNRKRKTVKHCVRLKHSNRQKKGLKIVYARVRYYCRKFYFNLARSLNLLDDKTNDKKNSQQ